MTSLASMTILAGCMIALGLFLVLIVFLVLVLDAREANRKAERKKKNHDAIIRGLEHGDKD